MGSHTGYMLVQCVQLGGSGHNGMPLYAKIGCMERETFTSTKLQLRVYTDNQCSQSYDDGQTARQRATKGYQIGGMYFPTKVSFRPAFYSCLSCAPEDVSGTFNKRSNNWYDDDYISKNNAKQGQGDQDNNQNKNDDYYKDNYFDDHYMAANDDVYKNNGNRRISASEEALQVRANSLHRATRVVSFSLTYT